MKGWLTTLLIGVSTSLLAFEYQKVVDCEPISMMPSIDICEDSHLEKISKTNIRDHITLIGAHEDLPLQVVPLRKSPSPNSMEVRIIFPKENSLERTDRIHSQVRLIGFPLGVKTRVPYLPSLRESEYGQHVRVVVDNREYFSLYLNAEDSADANLDVYRKTLSYSLPKDLQNGEHIVRVFPVLSFGESVKKPRNFDVTTFYKNTDEPVVDQSLTAPYITYNEPQGEYKLEDPSDPVLLDFYLSNCTLSREGYRVEVTIDGEKMGYLYQWSPYLIYGLKKGTHNIRVVLVGPDDQIVPGDFNVNERNIVIK